MFCTFMFAVYFVKFVLHQGSIKAPSILMLFRLKTHIFDALSDVVLTKTPENADVNRDFRKQFQKWRLLKMLRF